MYVAHAGHQHMEEGINQSISQPLIIFGTIVAVLAIVSTFVIYDMRKRRVKSQSKSDG